MYNRLCLENEAGKENNSGESHLCIDHIRIHKCKILLPHLEKSWQVLQHVYNHLREDCIPWKPSSCQKVTMPNQWPHKEKKVTVKEQRSSIDCTNLYSSTRLIQLHYHLSPCSTANVQQPFFTTVVLKVLRLVFLNAH